MHKSYFWELSTPCQVVMYDFSYLLPLILLTNCSQMLTYETHETMSHVLTPEGSSIALNGSHEARVWSALPVKGQGSPVNPKELEKLVGGEVAKVGQGRAFKNKWIAKEGDGLVKLVSGYSSIFLVYINL